MSEPASTTFDEWVILELMGHRRLAGRLTEQEIAGRGFLRLDMDGATQFYNPASVYGITPTTEQTARLAMVANRPDPVSRWELPAPDPMAGQPVSRSGADGAPW